jgi:predicted TIM-barrel fold metal-dependent hydrolase
MNIIDAHNHLGVRHGADQTGTQLVEKMDAAGVDRACVFPFIEGDFTNDVIDTAVAEHPGRLIPFMGINPWHLDAAVSEIHRRADTGFKGVKLHPTLHGYHLSDLGLVGPVLEAIRERGLVVISHGASDLYNAPPEFAAVCRAYPEIPFLMAHSGTFWSHDQAVELAAELPNLYLETARVPIFEVAHSVRTLGPEKVIWGTDSPFVDYTFEYEKMQHAVNSEEARLLVCGGNLHRLLGLDAQS